MPTSAARKTRPVDVVDQLYGGDVKISDIVLKETIPAVHPNAKMKPAWDSLVSTAAQEEVTISLTIITFGNHSKKNGLQKYCQ